MGTNINFNSSLGINKGCNITLASNPVTPLLLDTYPNAAVAYSLRKLRNAYSGSALQVRRVFDNTTQDIGFDSIGDLDKTALNSFVGNNLMLQSENFNTTWTKTNSVVTTGAITAPVGGGLADKLDENIATASHTLTQASGAMNIAGTYFFSVYLKAAERYIVEFVSAIAGSTQIARVNLTGGTIVSNTFANTPTLTSVGSGWYKFELLVTSTLATSSTGFQIRLTNGTSIIYAGTTGWGCYIWGAQMSGYTGSIVPYFKTTTVRAADASVVIWYDQSGNGNHASQTTTTGNQAAIVTNGLFNINTITGKIASTWTADRYDLSPGINPNTKYLSIGVVNRTTNTATIAQLGIAAAIGGLNGQEPLIWLANTGVIRSDMFTNTTHETNISTGNFIMTSEKNASNLKTAYLNGSALPLTSTEAPSAGTSMNTFGISGGNTTTGQYQEYIYWNSEQSANRVGIETNINTYWTIY
jgi:hypothetical protein